MTEQISHPINFKTDVPLAQYTSLNVGGNARFFVSAKTTQEVCEALAFADKNNLQRLVIGGGSNILVSDSGFDGVVIHMCINEVDYVLKDDRMIIKVGAGVEWDDFVNQTVERNLIGLECLSGIPGTVGGAVVSNLGAYGAQCSDNLVSVDILESDGEKYVSRVCKKDECQFSYHDSLFGRSKGKYFVTSATFSLATRGNSQLSYRDNRFDLKSLAKDIGHEPTPKEVREAILKMRAEKGMVPGMYKSAGSFFHMPFVSADHYQRILIKAQELDAKKEEMLRPWAWKQTDGSYKIAGGFLLEYTEFTKGYVCDGVGISPKHTLSIINVGVASANSIAELANKMQSAVEKIFDVHLEREVEYVGEIDHSIKN